MNKVRFGLIGTGRITSWVLKGAKFESRFVAQAICSRDINKAKRFANDHLIPSYYDSIDKMLMDKNIDAIYIGTPNHTHCDLAIKCMNAGKHVLCEKPLASNAKEVKAMIEVAKRNNVVLMEAMISTLNPNFVQAQSKISALGAIRKYYASFCQFSSKYSRIKEAIAEKDPALVPASFNPYNSGGALMDIGIYTIYPMVVLFGKPEKVFANSINMDVPIYSEDKSEILWKPIDIQASVDFRYKGFTASVSYSKVVDSFLPTEICGEEGNLLFDKIHICKKLDFVPHIPPSSGRGKDSEPIDISAPKYEDEYTCEFSEFINLINGDKALNNNSLENSLIVAEIMDEIRKQSNIKFLADNA